MIIIVSNIRIVIVNKVNKVTIIVPSMLLKVVKK